MTDSISVPPLNSNLSKATNGLLPARLHFKCQYNKIDNFSNRIWWCRPLFAHSISLGFNKAACVMLCWCVMTLHTLLAAVHTSSHHMVMTSESRIIKSFLSAQANLFTPGTHLHLPEPPQLPPLRTLFSPGWITSARAQQFHPPTSTWIDWLHTFCHTERKRRGGM